MLRVHSLYCFPVKSLAAASCRAVTVDDWGPSGDRRWMVVDEAGAFVTQRQLPAMCRIQASWRDAELLLQDLDHPREAVRVDIPRESVVSVKVWRDDCTAWDAGDEAADWLSQRLGRAVRLCFMPDSSFRQVDLDYAQPGERVSFADGFPFLICQLSSLSKLEEAVGHRLAMSRFRPNIVVEGGEAFAERHWRGLRIGELEFDLVKPCARCAIPTIDPATAERQRDVFTALRALCSDGREVHFGQNALHRGQGQVRVGDPVTVLS